MTIQQHRAILQSIAHRAMLQQGLLPDFSAAVLAELDRMQAPADVHGDPVATPRGIGDLTDLLWASIDNDDSRDLDQLTVAEVLPADKVKIRVAVADVDALIKNGSAIDEHARHNTTSPVEARVVHGFAGMDVGDRNHVQLVAVDIERGYIELSNAGSSRIK